MKKLVVSMTLALAVAFTCWTASAGTLEQIKERGFVKAGVNVGLPGFSFPDKTGNWSGLDVDFARAVAAAVLGDKDKVRFTPLSGKERFTALQSGEVDLLSRNTTWSMQRDTSLGLNFVGVIFYDGTGFMVKKDLGLKNALELKGATVCVNTGTSNEVDMADFFRAHKIEYKAATFESVDAIVTAFESGRCDAYCGDRSGLAAQRLKMKNPELFVLLPDVISKEPLGPVVRHGDDQWFDIVKWTLFAMIDAEERGITSTNIDQIKATSSDPNVRRILGLEGDLGPGTGLSKDWAYRIIKQVGNYGEIFNKNFGPQTPFKMERGLNALWLKGGLIYAPPLR
ncbi:MAG: amino acid ABC transporter substrate-binding protein [Thermodesulfobacteriota bacterium]